MIADPHDTERDVGAGRVREDVSGRLAIALQSDRQNAAMDGKADDQVHHGLISHKDRRIGPIEKARQSLKALLGDQHAFAPESAARPQEMAQDDLALGDESAEPAHKIALAHVPVGRDARVLRIGYQDWRHLRGLNQISGS